MLIYGLEVLSGGSYVNKQCGYVVSNEQWNAVQENFSVNRNLHCLSAEVTDKLRIFF